MSILKKKKPWTSLPTCPSPVNNTEGTLEVTLKVTVNIQIGPGEAHGNNMVRRKKQVTQISHKGTHPNHFRFPENLFKMNKNSFKLTYLLIC